MAIRLRTNKPQSRHYNENQYVALFLSFFIIATTFLGTTLQGANRITLKYFSSASEISAFVSPTIVTSNTTAYHSNSTTITNEISKQSQSSVSSKTKILGFSDQNYKEIAYTWYRELEQLGYDNHWIVAYDIPTQTYLRNQHNIERTISIHHYEDPPTNFTVSITEDVCRDSYDRSRTNNNTKKMLQMERRRMFASRWKVVLETLKEGYHVLLTDVDNVFVQYRSLQFLEDSEFDSYFAHAGDYPREVYQRTGVTLCGGMSWHRSKPSSMELVEAITKQCGCHTTLYCSCRCDDQQALSRLLLGQNQTYGIQWLDEELNNDSATNMSPNDLPQYKPYQRGSWDARDGYLSKFGVHGHKIRLWNRHVAFRYNYQTQDLAEWRDSKNASKIVCPDPATNWIAMPGGIQGNKEKLRTTWFDLCRFGGSYSNILEG